MKYKLLIIDDEPNILTSFSNLLKDENYKVETAKSAEIADGLISENNYDLILLDLNLPGKSGIDFLTSLRNNKYDTEVLVISGQSEIATAMNALKLGAVDYLEKPVSPEKLILSVKSVIMLIEASRQRNIVIEELDEKSKFIGKSKTFKKLLKTINQVAPTDTTVLVTGENGTGKELAATRLYLESKRRGRPFIKVNCPGIPETLFESELFGHKKGSFTGAVKDYPGKFVMADKGTLFLDEIGDLPMDCQAKLLRVLESGEVETIGDSELTKVDVRLICATNRNLTELMTTGKFREDLYYRISVFEVQIPPLRERSDDIPWLIGEFLKRYDPSDETKLSADAIAFLSTYNYPGNVRQLKNIIERLTILKSGKTVTLSDVSDQLKETIDSVNQNIESVSLSEKLTLFEKIIITKTLSECDGNISKASILLNVDRANLSRKIKEYKLKDNEQN